MTAVLLLLLACSRPEPQAQPAPDRPASPQPPRVMAETDPWVAVGDPHHDSAVIWAYTEVLTRVMLEAWPADDNSGKVQWRIGPREPAAPPDAATVQMVLDGLPADTAIAYRVKTGDGRQTQGRFRTAPLPGQPTPVRLAVGGDLGGQGWCRSPDAGYRILDSIAALDPQLFVMNGDQVYVDGSCPPQAPDGSANLQLESGHPVSVLDLDWTDSTALRRGIDRWWAYHRGDRAFRGLLQQVPMVAQWDDHEVVNDFGATWGHWETGDPDRPGYRILVDQARAAFFAWNPIRRTDPGRMYRSLRWGKHVELFIVDARSYRSPNTLPAGPDKTLLGADQLAWLQAGLRDSPATWKLVSVDVPMSIPTGSEAWLAGRDGWANGTGDASVPEGQTDISTSTGYEPELRQLLDGIRTDGVQGVVFLTTDVHHSRILRYDNGGVPVVEVVTGPLRAWSGQPGDLDPTFAPQQVYAEGEVFTFGLVEVDADGQLRLSVRGEDGQPRPGGELSLPAPTAP